MVLTAVPKLSGGLGTSGYSGGGYGIILQVGGDGTPDKNGGKQL